MEYVELSNGVKMPNFGLGTYLIKPNDALITTREGLKMGYRLIDTANAYGNEKSIGKGIKESLVKREDIFLSTKLWVTEYDNENAVEETLKRLDTDYIDLLFIHQPSGSYLKAYKMLEKAYKEHKIRAIGVSNFEGKYLDEILEKCEIKPHVIQAEAHPYFVQEELRSVLEKHNIKLMSWYPLGHGDTNLINEKIFKELGAKYHKKPTQIILRWHLQMGFITIPGSKSVEHIRENFDIFDFKLTDDEMKQIATLNKNKRYYTRTDDMLKKFMDFKPIYEN